MKFDILGVDIKIKKVKNLRDSEHLDGSYSAKESLIKYDPAQSDDELIDTLLHETIHAFCDIIGMHLDEHREEILCTNLPRVLLKNFDISCKQHK